MAANFNEITGFLYTDDNKVQNTMDWSNTLNRLYPIPVEKFSVFGGFSDAADYAMNNPVAYEGQVIAVKDGDVQKVYVVDSSALSNLRELASGASMDASTDELQKAIESLSADVFGEDGLSADLFDKIVSDVADEAARAIAAEAVLSDAIETVATEQAQFTEDVSASLFDKIEADDAATLEAAKQYTDELRDVLSSAWHFVGVKEAVPTGDDLAGYINGDIIVVGAKEYAFDGEKFVELGDEEGLNATNVQLENEISARQKADEQLQENIDILSATLDDEIARAISAETDLQTAIESLTQDSNDALEALSVELKTDIDNTLSALDEEIKRADEAEQTISAALDAKIKVVYSDEDEDAGNATSVDTLTIHKLSQSKYAELLKLSAVNEHDLYVISSEYLDAYGQKIINVADGEDATDAVTVGQLNSVSSELKQKIEEAVENGVDALSNEVFGSNGLKETLTQAIEDEAGRATAAEELLSGMIVDEIARAEGAEGDLDDKIEALANTVEAVSSDYVKESDFTNWKDLVGLSAANGTADGQVVTWGQVKDITTAMHFRDAIELTEEELKSEGAALAEIVASKITDPVAGDIVIDTTSAKEFVCVSVDKETGVATWRELGDENLYLAKSTFNDFIDNDYTPFVEAVELSAADLSDAVMAEAARAAEAEETLSGMVDELSTYTHALSVSQLVWDIDVIDCGNSYGF